MRVHRVPQIRQTIRTWRQRALATAVRHRASTIRTPAAGAVAAAAVVAADEVLATGVVRPARAAVTGPMAAAEVARPHPAATKTARMALHQIEPTRETLHGSFSRDWPP